jgi:hypothetical protein
VSTEEPETAVQGDAGGVIPSSSGHATLAMLIVSSVSIAIAV